MNDALKMLGEGNPWLIRDDTLVNVTTDESYTTLVVTTDSPVLLVALLDALRNYRDGLLDTPEVKC